MTGFDPSIFQEVAILLMLAAGVGFIGVMLRQPLIVSFIVVGIIAGPAALGLMGEADADYIHLLAELGIALLLFLVGLKLDVKLVRTLGVVALTTGLGQVIFTSVVGFFICLALGFSVTVSIYIAVALTFSSTIIIVKLLSDKREIDSLHGRIALGFLIVQDLVVVLAMLVLSAVGIGAASDEAAWREIAMVVASGLLLVSVTGIFIQYIAEPLLKRLARSPELMVAFAIGWAASFAALGDAFGFSKELGGLLAGVSLASTSFREAISARLTSLRDFLLLFFFLALGAQIDMGAIGEQIGPAVLLSLFVLIGNPLIVMVIMGVMGYRKRTGFLAGLTVAQISEFSLIFMALGVTLGHVAGADLSLVTLVALITIAMSTYMIVYSHGLYAWLEPWLGRFERRQPVREQTETNGGTPARRSYDAIQFGLGRYGGPLFRRLEDCGWRVLGVDFDPDLVRAWRAQDADVCYGDATDADYLADLPLSGAKWAILASPPLSRDLSQADMRLAFIAALKTHNFSGRIAVPARDRDDAEQLLTAGADLVLIPFRDAADHAADLIVGRTERSEDDTDNPLPGEKDSTSKQQMEMP